MSQIIDKPRRISITTIKIVIKKYSEQEQKLQELTEKIQNSVKGSKIRLILKIFSEDDAAMLKLQTQFFKCFCQKITYLKWEISGNISDAGQTKAIGEILRHLVYLYSLSISIKIPNFGDKGAASLAAGLSKLKKLHVLNLYLNYQHFLLTEKGIQIIKNATTEMSELEDFNTDLNSDPFPLPPKLASLKFSMYCFLFGNNNSNYLQSIIDRKNMIVEVFLGGYDCNINEEEDELKEPVTTVLRQLFTELLDFPYLTRLEHYLFSLLGKEMRKIWEIKERVKKLAQERYMMILHILATDVFISEFLPFNPQLILLDMIFDD